jgi:hypothetical protein
MPTATGEYTLVDIDAMLAPFTPAPTHHTQAQPAPLLPGALPSVFANTGTAVNAAAQAGVVPARRPHHMALIAQRCGQVATSLAAGGAGDSRDLWYLGNITLSVGCVDGDAHAHQLSVNGPNYNKASLDAIIQQARDEIGKKSLGYPTCEKYNTYRQGVCLSCPHWGSIRSPLSLGVENFDMPDGYRRERGWIERAVAGKDGSTEWVPMVESVAAEPRLIKLLEGHRLEYMHAIRHLVYFDESHMPENGAAQFFSRQHITLQPYEAKNFREFVVAWIKHLKTIAMVTEAVEPFSWTDAGFAVGDLLYRPDGTTAAVVCTDRNLAATYRPRGALAAWTAAANAILVNRPDLQVIPATAFAAPLVQLGNFGGGLVGSAYSRSSGTAKTTAAVLGQTVWGTRAGNIINLDDTANYTAAKLATLHNMPLYIDEAQNNTDDDRQRFVRMLYRITQGTDKGRLNRNSDIRKVGSWQSICMVTTNEELMDTIVKMTGNKSDAGALRMFSFAINSMYSGTTKPGLAGPLDANAGTAGAVYAAWLAGNLATAQHSFEVLYDIIHKELAAQPGERFLVGFVTCIMLGAIYAKKLGLVDFDVDGIKVYLKNVFTTLRTKRDAEITSLMAPAEVLDRFMRAYQQDTLVTDILATGQNVQQTPQTYLRTHPMSKSVVVQIGANVGTMRIHRDTFRGWCYENGIALGILSDMQLQWGANINRRCILGKCNNIDIRSQYIRCIEINLHHPDLAHVLDYARGLMSSAAAITGAAPALQPPPTGTP